MGYGGPFCVIARILVFILEEMERQRDFCIELKYNELFIERVIATC